MQALLANERTEDFKFLFRVFRELCEGAQPEVSPVLITLSVVVGHIGTHWTEVHCTTPFAHASTSLLSAYSRRLRGLLQCASVTLVANKVIFTDADQAAMTAIDEECPATHHKLCLFHMDENIMKHGRGLGQGILAAVKGTFHAAAYAQTEEVGNRSGHVKMFFVEFITCRGQWCQISGV